MEADRARFVAILYDCILFEFAAQVDEGQTYTLTLPSLGTAFQHVADVYDGDAYDRQMDVPCGPFIHQQKLTTQQGLRIFISKLDDGCSELFPCVVRLMEGNPDYLLLPGLSQSEMHDFVWEYGQSIPSSFHNDIAVVIHRLRRELWNSDGSGGGSIRQKSGLLAVHRFSKGYEQSMFAIHREEGIRESKRQDGVRLQDAERLSHAKISIYLKDLEKRCVLSSKDDDVAALQQRLQRLLRRQFQDDSLEVGLFGSYATGLSDGPSDADFTILNDQGSTLSIHNLGHALRQLGFSEVTTISTARVPIVTFRDPYCSISCDMSINQPLGVYNSRLIATYRRIDYRFRPMAFAVRQIAKKGNIHSAKDGFLSSYALTLMLITFLQDVVHPPVLPRLQERRGPLLMDEDLSSSQQQRAEGVSLEDWLSTLQDAVSNVSAAYRLMAVNNEDRSRRERQADGHSALEMMFSFAQAALETPVPRGSLQQSAWPVAPLQDTERYYRTRQDSALSLGDLLAPMLGSVVDPPAVTKKLKQCPHQRVEQHASGYDCSFDHSWSSWRNFGRANEQSLAELLIGFCKYFGHDFNYEEWEVNPRRGRMQRRPALDAQNRNQSGFRNRRIIHAGQVQDRFICIKDPFIHDRNVAGSCRGSNVTAVQKCFQRAYEALIEGDTSRVF